MGILIFNLGERIRTIHYKRLSLNFQKGKKKPTRIFLVGFFYRSAKLFCCGATISPPLKNFDNV